MELVVGAGTGGVHALDLAAMSDRACARRDGSSDSICMQSRLGAPDTLEPIASRHGINTNSKGRLDFYQTWR